MTTRRPRIAVTGPQRRAIMPRLLVGLILRCYGVSVIQLRPGDAIDENAIDGVVVTGGHDIDPVLYASKPEVVPRYDHERDAFESRMIDMALKRDLPILGICRGAQLLNARMGGSLYQELKSMRDKTSNRWTVLPLKTLLPRPNTRIAKLLDCTRCRINSLHNQGIDKIGHGLQVSAVDLDSIVQAVESPTARYLIGVQWHPEFLLYQRRQRRLFKALMQACSHST